MKQLIFASLLLAVICVSASAQSKCGRTVQLPNMPFSFCIPADWKPEPDDPKSPYWEFSGPGSGSLSVAAEYGDKDLKKVADVAVSEGLASTSPMTSKVVLRSRTVFKTDSKLEGEKLVFELTILGDIRVFVHYLFKVGDTTNAQFLWSLSSSPSETAAMLQADASMANFKLIDK